MRARPAPTVPPRKRRRQRARLRVRRAPTAPPAPLPKRLVRWERIAPGAQKHQHKYKRASTPMRNEQRSTAARAGVTVNMGCARSVQVARTVPKQASPRRPAPVTVRRATTAQLGALQQMKKRAAVPHTFVRKGLSRRRPSEAATSPSRKERARARASLKRFSASRAAGVMVECSFCVHLENLATRAACKL